MIDYHIPPISKLNKYIIAISSILFILSSVHDLTPYLGLNLYELMNGKLFTLMTFPFIEKSFTAQLFNCMLVWFIGSDIEYKLGYKNYLTFILVALGSACLFLILMCLYLGPSSYGLTLYGLNGLCFCLLMAYGTIFGDRVLSFMMVFPVKARYFCLLMIFIELYMGIFSPMGILAWGNLAALIGAMVYLKVKYGVTFIHSFELPWSFLKKFQQKKRPKLYIVDDNSKKPRYWQ